MKYLNINSALGDLNVWYKQRSGDNLTLADIPTIITLRWTWFVNNWNFIKSNLQLNASSAYDPNLLYAQITSLTEFIDAQQYIVSVSNPFANASIVYRFYEVFDNININSINLSTQEQAILNNTLTRVSNFTRNDFIDIQTALITERDYYADICGGSDPTYNQTFGRSSAAQIQQIQIADISNMAMIQSSIESVQFILANAFAISVTPADPFALAQANANNPDVVIGDYSTGTLIRFPYGASLEQLALDYLGSPDKWIDMAIANGLQPPYVDEVGQVLMMTANGKRNELSIAGTDSMGNPNISKLFINQSITITSNTLPIPLVLLIQGVRQIPVSGDIIVTVSGTTDLSIYRIADGASIRVFAPNTINSNFYILIPSTQPSDVPNQNGAVPWFLAGSSETEQLAQIDLLISDNGDLQFTQNNDLQLSYGLANDIQAMKLKVSIELGELQRDPEFGLVAIQGNTNANIDKLRTLLIESITNSVSQDPRFQYIESMSVDYISLPAVQGGGVSFYINMSVMLAGGGQVIPITFTINNVS